MTRRFKPVPLVVALLVVITTHTASADIVKNLARGLGVAGLSPQISRDLIQDAWVMNFGAAFTEREYDFGNVSLTLDGVLEGRFSISQRGVDEFTFELDTPQGLTYSMTEFVGSDKTQVTNGFFNILQKFTINRYGFYDLELMIDNRGTVTGDHIDGEQPLDFDIGPIDVHGHWMVDVVNLTLGQLFGFTLPGGAADQIVLGYFDEADIAELVVDQVLAEGASPSVTGITVIPEPATVMLLLLAMPMLWWTRRKPR